MRVHCYRPCPTHSRRATGAFTLVELLVVIGVIAVLIGLLLPVLAKARAQANRAVCLSNIRQLGAAILMYCNDNQGHFPTCAYAAGLAYAYYPDDWIHWQANRKLEDSAIAKYVGREANLKRLLHCPSDTSEGRKTSPGIAPGQGPYLFSYGMNDAIGRNHTPYGRWPRSKINQWRSPSRKIVLTEATERVLQAVWGYVAPLTHRHGTGRSRGNAYLAAGERMGIRVSAVFMDGHAEGVDDDFACDPIQAQMSAQ
jgi:Tfp pilus assembly protein PilE